MTTFDETLESIEFETENQSTIIKSSTTLSKVVEQRLNDYFANLEGQPAQNVYDMVIKEVEKGLLSVVLQQVNGNQSKAATILGLSRGTLRKKLKENNMDVRD